MKRCSPCVVAPVSKLGFLFGQRKEPSTIDGPERIKWPWRVRSQPDLRLLHVNAQSTELIRDWQRTKIRLLGDWILIEQETIRLKSIY